jgi:hypothetical protein
MLTLITLVFCLRGFAQQNDYNDIYAQGLNYFCNPLAFADTKNNQIYEGGKAIIDTIIVQKENYMPDVWPEKIKNHVIISLTKDEINAIKGKSISVMTMSPIRKSGGIYYMKMTNYGKRNEVWHSWGYHMLKFTYDSKLKRYQLSEPMITFCNFL